LPATLILETHAQDQDTRVLTYQDAIYIALSQSYTVKSYSEQKRAMEYFYNYRKAMFKPRLDFNTFLPALNENVQEYYDYVAGLSLYRSIGQLSYDGGEL